MELPLYAHGEPPQGKGLRETMSHFMPQNYRELSQFFFLFIEFDDTLLICFVDCRFSM